MEGVPPVAPDAGDPTSKMRRGRSMDTDRNGSKKSKVSNGDPTIRNPWKVPPFPNSWKRMMQNGTFSLLCEWRNYVNKHNQDSVAKLISAFDINLENPPSGGKQKKHSNGGNTRSRLNRRAPQEDATEEEESSDAPEVRVVLANPQLARRGKSNLVTVIKKQS